jgi:hypothetical protein
MADHNELSRHAESTGLHVRRPTQRRHVATSRAAATVAAVPMADASAMDAMSTSEHDARVRAVSLTRMPDDNCVATMLPATHTLRVAA